MSVNGGFLDGPEDALEVSVEIAWRDAADLNELYDDFFGEAENFVIIFMHGRLFFLVWVRVKLLVRKKPLLVGRRPHYRAAEAFRVQRNTRKGISVTLSYP
jgi:hypothetical protein